MQEHIKKLQDNYESNINAIIDAFCKKHDLKLDYHYDLSLFFFGDYYTFNISDILYDVFNNLPNGVIEEWFTYNCQWNYFDPDHHINLHSWSHGCPRRTDEQLKKIEKLHQNIRDAEAVFKQQITELNENTY
jgi:hypothetical protein